MRVAIQAIAAAGTAASAIEAEIIAAHRAADHDLHVRRLGGEGVGRQRRPEPGQADRLGDREPRSGARTVRLPGARAAIIAVRHETQLAKATSATQPTTSLVSTEPYIAQPTISAAATAVMAKKGANRARASTWPLCRWASRSRSLPASKSTGAVGAGRRFGFPRIVSGYRRVKHRKMAGPAGGPSP